MLGRGDTWHPVRLDRRVDPPLASGGGLSLLSLWTVTPNARVQKLALHRTPNLH